LSGSLASASPSIRVEPRKINRVESGEARFDETDLDGSPFIDTQAAMSLSLYKSVPAGNGTELKTRKDALQAKLPLSAHQDTFEEAVGCGNVGGGSANVSWVLDEVAANDDEDTFGF
jgi:hypothetical protein